MIQQNGQFVLLVDVLIQGVPRILGKISEMKSFVSLLTTFEVRNIFRGSSVISISNRLKPKP